MTLAEKQRNNYEKQSPGHRQRHSPPNEYANADYAAADESREMSNVQVAAVWRLIEANIAKYKKDSQSDYRQILDE